MPLFQFTDEDELGKVISVDSASVVVQISDLQRLQNLQVNRLVVLESHKAGQSLIGVVNKITRRAMDEADTLDLDTNLELTLSRVTLIGTLLDRVGQEENVFRRTLETVPDIDARCFPLEGDRLSSFMRVVSSARGDETSLNIGTYTLDDSATAYINGNKFFQRHSVIVGSTGSGKSWTTTRIIEQMALLKNPNAVVLDIHGEYASLNHRSIRHYKVAGPGDLDQTKSLDEGVLFLPYWLLGYETLTTIFVDRSDQNAPNQAMLISRSVTDAKKTYLMEHDLADVLKFFTVDSPVPYSIAAVVAALESLDTEMVAGARPGTEKQGEFHGKLSRLIVRLQNKISDRRYGFLFTPPPSTLEYNWLPQLANLLVGGSLSHSDGAGGIKIVDFSDVPSDVLPLIVSLIARVIFEVQQWSLFEHRHPIALLCDEAHTYISEREGSGGLDIAAQTFERIAKEGRKYGVGLLVISQRPSEVNRTVLSQCNNFVAMRLTNSEDQAVIRRLLPDSLGGFADLLPVLDVGEALVVGDASLLPSRVRVAPPQQAPTGGTLPFWDRWTEAADPSLLPDAVEAWRRQMQQ